MKPPQAYVNTHTHRVQQPLAAAVLLHPARRLVQRLRVDLGRALQHVPMCMYVCMYVGWKEERRRKG